MAAAFPQLNHVLALPALPPLPAGRLIQQCQVLRLPQCGGQALQQETAKGTICSAQLQMQH